jgi:hypothetical protein
MSEWKDTSYGGFPIRIYCTDAGGQYPIHGAFMLNGHWHVKCWREDGRTFWEDTRCMDLVPANPISATFFEKEQDA